MQAQHSKLLSDGVSALTFLLGVLNLGLSAFIIGRWPQHYWLVSSAKGLYYFPARILRQSKQSSLTQQLKLSWMTNSIFLFLTWVVVVAIDELHAGL